MWLGAAAAYGTLGGVRAAAGAGAPPTDHKAWARRHFRGFENILMPSFTPDLADLDEAGIRHDVRQSIAHGVFSVFCAGVGLNPEERRRFMAIAAEEGAGRIAVGTSLGAAGPDRDRKAFLRAAEQAGCTHVLIHPPHDFRPRSQEELYAWYRDLIEATELAVVLWATDGRQFTHLHPSNVVLPVYDRLADLPNVVAVKLMTTLDLPTVYRVAERLHDRLLVGGVHLGVMPLLVKHYGMQWSGAWTVEALQSPEKRYVVDYLLHLLDGREAQADALWWQMKPAYDALFELMSPMLPKGVHPFTHLKYYQWCVGGNGGLLRAPRDPHERQFPLRPQDRAAIRAAYQSIGITPREADDEAFVVGMSNYRKGVRAADMAALHTYVG